MMHVRKARVEDVGSIVAFQSAMALEAENTHLDRDVLERGVRAVLDDPSKAIYWIAEEGGKPVGVVRAVPEWSSWRNGTWLWINDVYVVPEARRRGAFRQLFEHLRRQVEADPELRGLRLYAHRENRRAHAVYEAVGMARAPHVLFEWVRNR